VTYGAGRQHQPTWGRVLPPWAGYFVWIVTVDPVFGTYIPLVTPA